MTYSRFYKRYLEETPQHLDGADSYDPLSKTILELLFKGAKPVSLGDNTFKITSSNSNFYWVGSIDGSSICLCCNTESVDGFEKITSTSKNPDYLKKPPYAIDLYLKIAENLPVGVRFSSDKIVSSDGFKVWQHIFNAGKSIAVYDNSSNTYSAQSITSMADLEKYFDTHSDFQKYQYVLAETLVIIDIKGSFAIMECKRLADYPLQQLFKDYNEPSTI